MRVVVVGAGLGGVSAAVGLCRAGHEVLLYERGAELREAGTGVVIMPNGVRALDELGLGDAVRRRAMPAVTGGLRDWRGRPLLVTDAGQAQQEVGTVAVAGRAELHRALRAPLPPESVRTATAVERLEPTENGVSVISGGERVDEADAVIVADGIGSTLRGRLFPDHPGLRRAGRLDLRGTLPAPPASTSPNSWQASSSTGAPGRCSACSRWGTAACTGSPTPRCASPRRPRRRRAGRCCP